MHSPRRAILFADIVDSTGIYESLGDHQALALVNLLFRSLGRKVAANDGSVVKTLGDGMVCQFGSADAALHAACEMQSAAQALAPRAPGSLAIRIAFTFGPVVLRGGDVFGDTVNLSAGLVALANPGQVLTTRDTMEKLSPALHRRCRALYPVKVKGRAQRVPACDVVWRPDADMTETLAEEARAPVRQEWRLKLTHAGDSVEVDEKHEVHVGRDRSNALVVRSMRASRIHARIYAREGNFVIVDQSSNGTYLLVDGNSEELVLRRESALLGERGWIGLGASAERHGEHVLRYRRVRAKH